MRTIGIIAVSLGLATPAFAGVIAPGGKTTIHHTMRVGVRTVHWKTRPLPDQSDTAVYIRVKNYTITVLADDNSLCAGNATWRDLVVRVDGCGKGNAPLKVSAVRMASKVPLKVSLEIYVVAP